jgi:Fis family transcriptional regulator, factor for inversion stimulation protein
MTSREPTADEAATAKTGAAKADATLADYFTTAQVTQGQTLRDSVAQALANYFTHLDGQMVTDVYQMVLSEVEAPLLEAVMQYTRENQTKASILLGLNRGTLRKKLKQYDLL